MFPVRKHAGIRLPLCKRGIEGDLLFAGSLLGSKIKIKSKSPLTPLFQRGECNV